MLIHYYNLEFDGLSENTHRGGNPLGLYDVSVESHTFGIQPLNFPLVLELCYCGRPDHFTKIAAFNNATDRAVKVAPTVCFKRTTCCYRFRDSTGAVVPVLGTARLKFTQTYGM